ILELYLNKIFLGYRAYGVEAAAQVYFGRSIAELSLAESAMVAALPKAPSVMNPLDNPGRTLERRDWILGRMHELGYIDDAAYSAALAEAVNASYHGPKVEVRADYAAEMVRSEMIQRFGTAAYVDGYLVDTTLDGTLQAQAQAAVFEGLMAYDARHGWRGAEDRWEGPPESWPERLGKVAGIAGLRAAVVTRVGEREIDLIDAEGKTHTLGWDQGLSGARPYINADFRGPAPKAAGEVLAVGDLVRLRTMPDGAQRLAQIPAVQGALVSLDAGDGAIRAIVGGLDFRQSKFNRVSQAQRQPGSNIKPFIYAAAMEHGFAPASIINDAPVVFQDPSLETVWRPENDSGKFYGPTSLRAALVNSRNLVSIRLLQQLGIPVAVDYLVGLGFPRESVPPNLSLALGTLTTTPLRLVSAYAVLANGGYRVEPHLLRGIRRVDGQQVERILPARACDAGCQASIGAIPGESAGSIEEVLEAGPATAPDTAPIAPRVMDPRAAYMIDSILKDAIKQGTGRRALELKRTDIAGKTGTTNGPMDAWFSGYVGNVVTTAWLGFDQHQPLGRQEYGGSAALPVWVSFMREALRGLPTQERVRPEGLVSVRVDPRTGLLAAPGSQDAVFEYFPLESVPPVTADGDEYGTPYTDEPYEEEDIF
ncbi:MAG: penicillin-binding protein 1A, partial [Gammaproteobacteria bacterium]